MEARRLIETNLRGAVMKSKLEGTYLGRALADQELEQAGGQFGSVDQPSVTGTAELQQVPRLPAESPFATDPVPTEPPVSGPGHE
jgi:hypothetical protein